MNRFDRSCIRAFFTLPPHLLNIEGTTTQTLFNKPFAPKLRDAGSIIRDKIKYYIIWFDDPETLTESDSIDFSFRDFSSEGIVPVVLIRKGNKS